MRLEVICQGKSENDFWAGEASVMDIEWQQVAKTVTPGGTDP